MKFLPVLKLKLAPWNCWRSDRRGSEKTGLVAGVPAHGTRLPLRFQGFQSEIFYDSMMNPWLTRPFRVCNQSLDTCCFCGKLSLKNWVWKASLTLNNTWRLCWVFLGFFLVFFQWKINLIWKTNFNHSFQVLLYLQGQNNRAQASCFFTLCAK